MGGRWAPIGSAFLLSGVLLATAIVLSFPELPLSACTDVGYLGDEPPGGFEFEEFSLGWVGYSPDGGVNRCDTLTPTIAAGLLAVGGVILAVDARRR